MSFTEGGPLGTTAVTPMTANTIVCPGAKEQRELVIIQYVLVSTRNS